MNKTQCLPPICSDSLTGTQALLVACGNKKEDTDFGKDYRGIVNGLLAA